MESVTATKKKPRKEIKVGEELIVSVDRIRPFPNQPRTYFDMAGLKLLSESIEQNGQITPAPVKKVDDSDECDYELIDGQRRWHAIQMAGLKNMVVLARDSAEIPTEYDQFKLSVMSNFGRAEHTPIEIAQAIERFRDEGETLAKIGNIFAKSHGWVEQHLKILQLAPEVLEMMDPELPKEQQLRYSTALDIADLPEKHQFPIAKMIIGKEMKLYEARTFIRTEMERRGISRKVGKRHRRPDDDFKILDKLVHRFESGLNFFAEKPQEFFNLLFQNRSEQDPVYLRDTIRRITEYLNSISEKTKQALDNKRAQQ